MERESRALDYDFVEALAFSSETYVLLLGKMVDKSEVEDSARLVQGDRRPVYNQIGLWYKPWFFLHAKSYVDRGVAGREIVPLR